MSIDMAESGRREGELIGRGPGSLLDVKSNARGKKRRVAFKTDYGVLFQNDYYVRGVAINVREMGKERYRRVCYQK